MYLSATERKIIIVLMFIVIMLLLVAYSLYLDEIITAYETISQIFLDGLEVIHEGGTRLYQDIQERYL